VFNPTWTIPPGIMYRTILPNLKKDPNYLGKKGFLLLTHDGKEVDPLSVDWASIDKMPYIVRQPAGPNNSLGLVKFLFPNKHLVYLHDTNHREHFADASRSFSSGCVRIEKPFDFAEKLLAGQGDWNRSKIDATVSSGETKWVKLDKPIRIIIAYSTASARNGKVRFKEDIYHRDNKVLKALDAPFKIRAQDK
jgi:L,D-transpeptidase YcbB